MLVSFSGNVFAQNETLDSGIKKAQTQWEEAKYKLPQKSDRLAKYEECAVDAQKLALQFPTEASPIVWQGICTASQAELLKVAALGKAKAAKALFEGALKIDEKALNGSAYTNLGVLYHRVPGWPIGFGSKELAQENFKKALEIAPNNVDANYFYALFLIDQDKKDEALARLKIALDAPSRNRPFADKKRKEEVQNKINELTK